MRKEFVMRGSTASGLQEVLNFSGYKPGYAYRLVELEIYPSSNILGQSFELAATITAAKTYEDPSNPDFDNEGLIGTAYLSQANGSEAGKWGSGARSVVNDTFLITQNLIIAVIDTFTGSPMAVNWQCRFVAEKMTGPEEATANYKQFAISDG